MPPKANRIRKNYFSPRLYRGGYGIDDLLDRIKDFHRLATRYDKIAVSFLTAIVLTAAVTYGL